MRPRTKIPIPEPKGTEFENFDRLTRILLSKPVLSRPAKPSGKGQPPKDHDRERLPRP